jgi:hypothetical protein
MLFREVVTYSENHLKPINKLCVQNAELRIVKYGGTYSYQWTVKC